MHIHSNEIPAQNQLTMEGLTHKLYIHTQALEFCQCGTNSTLHIPTTGMNAQFLIVFLILLISVHEYVLDI